MSSNQMLLYDTYMNYYNRAMQAKDAGDNATARKYFLLAAETLRDLAQLSDGELKKARYNTVKKLIAAAESLSGDRRVRNDGGRDDDKNAVRDPDDPTDEYDLNIMSPSEKVSFDEIIGMDDAKTAIRRMLINPLSNPEVYKQYGLDPGGNILLEGPPGTGKTTFAKATACEITLPFVVATGPSLVDSLIGQTAKNINKLFSEVRRLSRNRKCPVILFFDEFDAIAGKRTSDNKTAAEAVPELLQQLDGFATGGANLVIIAATNLKDDLDDAILSRFKKIIYIPLPNEKDREQLFGLKLRRIKKEDLDQIDLKRIATMSKGLSGRDINGICGEFINILAERDAGFAIINGSLNAIIEDIVSQRLSSMKSTAGRVIMPKS